MPGLTLAEFSDREVLAVVADCADENGVATSIDIAERMNLSVRDPIRNVGVRLSWLVRYGVLEHPPGSEQGRWRLTDFGLTMTNGNVPQGTRDRFERLGGAQVVTLMQDVIGARYWHSNPTEATMIRRAWQYGTHPLRRS